MFKTGGLGTGYYKDGVPEQRTIDLHKMLWPTAGLQPITIKLDEVLTHNKVIGDAGKATIEDEPVQKESQAYAGHSCSRLFASVRGADSREKKNA